MYVYIYRARIKLEERLFRGTYIVICIVGVSDGKIMRREGDSDKRGRVLKLQDIGFSGRSECTECVVSGRLFL